MSRSERTSHTDAARFVRALFLAILVLTGTLGRTWHVSTTEHVVCPEHGELLEREPLGQHHAPRDVEGPAIFDPGTNEHDDDHDLCGLVGLLAERGLDSSSPPAHLAALAAACTVDPPRTDVRAPGIPRHRLAPKHSPPAESSLLA